MQWKLHSIDRFDELSATWDALQSQMGGVPFLESRFVNSLLTQFGHGDECLALCEADGETVAASILVRHRAGVWASFQASQLPLGAFVAAKGFDVANGLSKLIRTLPGFALNVGLTQVDPDLLVRPADLPGLSAMDYIDTAWVDIEGSFEAYWDARGKNLKQNLRKQRNKLETDGVATALDCIVDSAAVAEAIREYGALESAGWKAGGGTAVSLDNAQGRFYRAMFESFCAAGRGRIYRYRFGEKVVAMDLCIESGSTLVILKTAYDESIKSLSPAFLMRQDQFRQLFDEGRLRRVEFFGRVMEWHTRWTDRSRTLFHVTAYRWPLLQSIHNYVRRARQARADARAGEVADAAGNTKAASSVHLQSTPETGVSKRGQA
jgi:CelD/BcsL family acetyltransferase involved in cellulose biosynthesis